MELNMSINEILKNKSIKVIEVPKWGTFLRKQWENVFANHLSHNEKKEIFMYDDDGFCGYLWHVFSFEKRVCLKEQEAETAFNNERKNSCYIFYQHTDDVFIVEEAANLNANDLLNEFDVYVVDKEFNWTYVKTHETGWCDPYFSYRDTKA